MEVLNKYVVPSYGSQLVVDLVASHSSWMVTTSGKKYLDCHSQYASQALGWNHPALLAIDYGHATTVKLANPDLFSEAYVNFVDKFRTIAPGFEKFFFIDGGALGVENAVKAAFDWKAQKLGWDDDRVNELDIIHFKQAFHGRSGYTLSLTNTDPNKVRLFPKFRWTRVQNPKIELGQQIELDSLDLIEKVLQRNNVAAILIEPIQGEGGDNHFRPQFLRALRDYADKYETLLIFDEVQTGVGMTGKMWCHEHFGVQPDLMAFGKKTQVCGFCSTNRINEVEHNVMNTPSRICSTWGGNLVDMVRFTTIASVIQEDNLVENAATIGDMLLAGLREIAGLHNVRGRGLMIAFDLNTPEERNVVLDKLRENLLILPCGEKSIRLRPHLTIDEETANLVIDFIKRAVK